MTMNNFELLLRKVCAAFGKSSPNGEIKAAVWERIRDVPDRACGFIATKIMDENTLPSNLGKTILGHYFRWAEDNMQVKVMGCADCNYGWYDCWKKEADNKFYHFVSPCAKCNNKLRLTAFSRTELSQSGAWVMPANYPGGIVKFELDKGFVPEFGDKVQSVSFNTDLDMRINSDRLRHMPEHEVADNYYGNNKSRLAS